MKFKKYLSDYSEYEFAVFIQAIKDCSESEEVMVRMIAHFNELVGGAGGSDLIFYPEKDADSSAAGIVATIQAWCRSNGVDGLWPGVMKHES